MSIIAVKASKPRADCKLGFNCKVMDGSVVVTSVVEGGLFGGTDLEKGHEILRINGTSVKNIGTNAMIAILASLPSGDVSIIVKSSKRSNNDGVFFDTAGGRGRMKTRIEDMPQILKDASVPDDKWWLIYTLVVEDLMPMSIKCVQSNEGYNREMKNYLQKDSSEGPSNSNKERAVHMKGVQTGILHNNATLAAISVKDRVNSILSKYHVMAILACEKLPLHPRHHMLKESNHTTIAIGFHFCTMDYMTVCAVPTEPNSESTEPIIAVPLVPSEPILDC